MGGGASHFNDVLSLGTNEAFHTYYTLDNKRIDPKDLPADFYTTNAFASQLNTWIKDTPKDQPIFAYLPFTAPHDPLQAPDEWISKFDGKYDAGFSPIYAARIKRLKELSLLPENAPLPQLNLQARWDELSEKDQKYTAKTMQVYAAMIAYMDDQIGTVFKTLQETGRDKNTIIIFLGDNGASPLGTHLYFSDPNYWAQFNDSYENIGRKGSFISYGTNWADVSNAPYGIFHKTTSAQGGINTNLIISGANIKDAGSIKSQALAIYDIAPTLYDMAGIKIETSSDQTYHGRSVLPMIGISLKEYFESEASENITLNKRYDLNQGVGIELHNQASFIDGKWKIRRLIKPSDKEILPEWELFNLESDPTETQNIANLKPDILNNLINKYREYAKKTMVIEGKGGKLGYIGLDPITNAPLSESL